MFTWIFKLLRKINTYIETNVLVMLIQYSNLVNSLIIEYYILLY